MSPQDRASELSGCGARKKSAQTRATALVHRQIAAAAAATLNAIHRAGGYVVHEPDHRDRIQRALAALEQAVVVALNGEAA